MPTMFAYPPVRKNEGQLDKAPSGGNAHIQVNGCKKTYFTTGSLIFFFFLTF